MEEEFYTEQVGHQANNLDFKSEQREFATRTDTITRVQDEYKLYIDHYLQKDQKEGVDAPLFDLIDANGDQEDVITYIDFELENKLKGISRDDLAQLKDLKTVLEKQDYKEKIYIFPNNVNFGITSGTYKEEGKKYNIIMQNIKKLRKNRYKLLLQREGSKTIDKFEVHYDDSDYVSIYDQFGSRIGRELIEKDKTIFINGNKYRQEQYQTLGKLGFSPSNNESIELNLVFVA